MTTNLNEYFVESYMQKWYKDGLIGDIYKSKGMLRIKYKKILSIYCIIRKPYRRNYKWK